MRIYFTFEPRPDLREPLVAEFPQVDFIFENGLSNDELQQADVLVTYGEDLNEENIQYATKVKWIFVASAGIEKCQPGPLLNEGYSCRMCVAFIKRQWQNQCLPIF